MVINLCSLYRGTPMVDTYIVSFSFLDWSLDHWVVSLSPVKVFILKSVLSDTNISTWIEIFSKYFYFFFNFFFAWNIFLYLPTFILPVPLGLGWVSYRQHIYGFCFCIHSSSLYLLVRAFNLFIFKVIIDIYIFLLRFS